MWVNEISLFAKSFRFVADQMEPKERKPANGGKVYRIERKRDRGVVRILRILGEGCKKSEFDDTRVADSSEAPRGPANFFSARVLDTGPLKS